MRTVRVTCQKFGSPNFREFEFDGKTRQDLEDAISSNFGVTLKDCRIMVKEGRVTLEYPESEINFTEDGVTSIYTFPSKIDNGADSKRVNATTLIALIENAQKAVTSCILEELNNGEVPVNEIMVEISTQNAYAEVVAKSAPKEETSNGVENCCGNPDASDYIQFVKA